MAAPLSGPEEWPWPRESKPDVCRCGAEGLHSCPLVASEAQVAIVRQLRDMGATRIRVGDIEADFPPELPELPASPRSRPPTADEYRREQERVLGVDLSGREEGE